MRISYLVVLYVGLLHCGCADGAGESANGPSVTQTDDYLQLSVEGKPVLRYQITEVLPDGLPDYYRRSGFLHPVYAPNGFVVTDDFPEGHTHQHGIFTAWTKTAFRGDTIDFWNQHKQTGTVEHVSVLETDENGSTAGFRVRLQHLSLDHGPVLQDDWHIRVRNSTESFRWELRSEQTNITDDTLFLLPHAYGGLGVRGSQQWNPEDSTHYRQPARFLTSEGLGRVAANHTRPEWTAIYGDRASLTVYPSPDNFRSPQYVRVHPEMPYLSVTPIVEEGFYIAPGERYVSKYAFEVATGPPGGGR